MLYEFNLVKGQLTGARPVPIRLVPHLWAVSRSLACIGLARLTVISRYPGRELADRLCCVQKAGQFAQVVLCRLLPADAQSERWLPEVVPRGHATVERVVHERVDHIEQQPLALLP